MGVLNRATTAGILANAVPHPPLKFLRPVRYSAFIAGTPDGIAVMVIVPRVEGEKPSRDLLAWHGEAVFLGSGGPPQADPG